MRISRIFETAFIGLSFSGIAYIAGDHVLTINPRRLEREVRVVEAEAKVNAMYASYMDEEIPHPSLRRGPFGSGR